MSQEISSKILVYGVCGSGKTTLAEQISQVTGIPWHSVDDLTWEPNWVEVDTPTQRERITKIVREPEWILDTAYGKWIDIPLAEVELIVALDYSRAFTLWRLIKRTVSRAVDKKRVCNGNVESWRLVLSKKSIIVWHFQSFRKKKAKIASFKDLINIELVVLRNQFQTDSWIKTLANRTGLPSHAEPTITE